MDISVITPTWVRPKFLLLCLHQFRNQNLDGIKAEHIVVSDGPDKWAKNLCEDAGANYFELDKHKGHMGAYARQMGMEKAKGKYFCFWDDDNLFYPNAIKKSYSAAKGHDIGIVQIKHLVGQQCSVCVIPKVWTGKPMFGRFDTLNICLRREVALSKSWVTGRKRSVDFHWVSSIFASNPKLDVNFVKTIVGEHICRTAASRAVQATKKANGIK